MSRAGDTTKPAHSTRGSRAEAHLTIRWVAPSAGVVLPMTGAETVLGRDASCDFVLESSEASRRHAVLVRQGPIHVLRDLESTNGVHVDGKRAAQAPIGEGSVIRLGDWLGVVESLDAEQQASATLRELAPGLLGGPAMAASLHDARVAATTALPIILRGGTGTGKERVAHAIHAWSGRGGPLIAINCAALPEALAEGELFGYRKGAFTGADRNHPGHFRAADGGTLLLDEIADLPLTLQAKLLRVLEEGAVTPLGESLPVPVDVRILSATQESLGTAVREKRFRGDLYARLDGLTVELPDLCKRRGDIAELFRHFVAEAAAGASVPRIGARFLEVLCLYDWPFNVRQLRLLAQRLVALHGSEAEFKRSHLPDHMRSADPSSSGELPTARLESFGDDLLSALKSHGGNVAGAARQLGISRQRVYRLMEQRSGVDLDELRESARQGVSR